MEESAQKIGELLAEEIIKPLAPKPLEARIERIKREFAPVVGDFGYVTAIFSDSSGRLTIKAPARVEKVNGDKVYLVHKNGKHIGWRNLRGVRNGDDIEDFFFNLSGYFRCMTMDFARVEDIDKAYPGTKYCIDENSVSSTFIPEDAYARRAEMRVGALRRRRKEVFETRYECQAVRFDEVTRNRTLYKRETVNGMVMHYKNEPILRLE